MGAYLSKPVTEKESTDGKNNFLSFGSSSLQGWRVFQEDAHNCCLNYDPDEHSALFAVYDGHGGAEVAQYCSQKFPGFLRSVHSYAEGNIEKALEEAFLGFDASLVEPEVQAELKLLAKETGGLDDDSSDDEDEDPRALQEEATLPLESVLEKYGGADVLPAHVKTALRKNQFQSPIVQKKKGARDEAGGSSAAGAGSSEAVSSSSAQLEQAMGENDNNLNIEREKAASTPSEDAKLTNGKVVDADEKEESSPNSKKVVEDNSAAKKEEAVDGDEDEDDADYTGDDTEKDVEGKEEVDSEEDEDDEDEEEDSSDDEDFDEEDDDDEENCVMNHLMDEKTEPGADSGTTAVVALLGAGGKVYVANAGDSRCVLCREGKAIDLSVDHKPEDTGERKRINNAGGSVTTDGRVNGGLNLSRAIGDHAYKQNTDLDLKEQMITALPDIICEQLIVDKDEFMVLACDGIWNSLTSQEVVDFIRERITKGLPLSKINEELFDQCLAPDTSGDGTGCDNMTSIIIRFDDLDNLINAKHGASRKRQLSNGNGTHAHVDSEENSPKKVKKLTSE